MIPFAFWRILSSSYELLPSGFQFLGSTSLTLTLVKVRAWNKSRDANLTWSSPRIRTDLTSLVPVPLLSQYLDRITCIVASSIRNVSADKWMQCCFDISFTPLKTQFTQKIRLLYGCHCNVEFTGSYTNGTTRRFTRTDHTSPRNHAVF